MGRVGSEVKVGLKSPSVEGLKFVKELRRHSSGDVGKAGCVDCVVSKQDTEKNRGFAICIRPKREADIADFAGIKEFGRLRHGFFELRLVYESGGNVHKVIIARPCEPARRTLVSCKMSLKGDWILIQDEPEGGRNRDAGD